MLLILESSPFSLFPSNSSSSSPLFATRIKEEELNSEIKQTESEPEFKAKDKGEDEDNEEEEEEEEEDDDDDDDDEEEEFEGKREKGDDSRINSNERGEYQCTFCKRKFVRPGHLDRHIRAHTGEKPYACLHKGCDKRFTRSDNMMQHFKCHSSDGYIHKREEKLNEKKRKMLAKKQQRKLLKAQKKKVLNSNQKNNSLQVNQVQSQTERQNELNKSFTSFENSSSSSNSSESIKSTSSLRNLNSFASLTSSVSPFLNCTTATASSFNFHSNLKANECLKSTKPTKSTVQAKEEEKDNEGSIL